MSKTCRQAFLANRLTQAVYMLVKKVKHWANKCDRYFPLRTTSSWWGWMNTDFTFIMWWEKGQQALSNWTDYIRAVLLPPSGLAVIKWSIMQLLRSYFLWGTFAFPAQFDMIDWKAMTGETVLSLSYVVLKCIIWAKCIFLYIHTHTHTHTPASTHTLNVLFAIFLKSLKKAAVIAWIDLRVPESKKIQKALPSSNTSVFSDINPFLFHFVEGTQTTTKV